MKAAACYELSNIILDLNGTKVFLLEEPSKEICKSEFGGISKGQIDLSINEAEELINSLQTAIITYKEIDKAYEEYCAQQAIKEEQNDLTESGVLSYDDKYINRINPR